MSDDIEVLDFSPSTSPKKSNKGLIILVILLIIIILGLVGFILYDKGIIFNAKEKVKTEEKADKKVKKAKKVTEYELSLFDEGEINRKFKDEYRFVTHQVFNEITTLSKSPASRLWLIACIMMDGSETKPREDQAGYTGSSKESFESKYKEIYGDNYSFESDKSMIGQDESKIKEDDNGYYWVGTFGTSNRISEVNITKLTKEDNGYVLSGKYIEKLDVSTEEGTEKYDVQKKASLKIIYNINDEGRHLVDIVIKE